MLMVPWIFHLLVFWITSIKFHWIPWIFYVTCFGILWSTLLISLSFYGITILLANQHRNNIFIYLMISLFILPCLFTVPLLHIQLITFKKNLTFWGLPPPSHSCSYCSFHESLCFMPGFLFWFVNCLYFSENMFCKSWIHCS